MPIRSESPVLPKNGPHAAARQVSVFKVPDDSGWVTEAQPIVYRIGDEEAPAVLQTCQLDLDARISRTLFNLCVGSDL
jgi:hypothetical protein